MSTVRQYIGARYVIKIYENSNDPSSAEWEQGNFEPLVMVTWQNGSYLSKKEVPGSVGNPADNPDYWVQTGFYNGQIANLQAQIDTINNTTIPALDSKIDDTVDYINSLTRKRYVFICDSYGTVQSNRFPTVLASTLGKTVNTDFFYNCIDGTGFHHGSKYFAEMLADVAANITDKDTITDVVVCGGVNDSAETDSDIIQGINDFCTYSKTNFPNARIHIGFISRAKTAGAIYNIYDKVLSIYKNYAMAYGATFIESSPTWLQYPGIDSDNLHPNSMGCAILAWCCANYLKGNNSQYYAHTTATLTLDQTDIASTDTITITEKVMTNGLTDVTISKGLFTLTNMTGSSFANGLKVGSFTSDTYVNAVDYGIGSITVPLMIRIKENGVETWYSVMADVLVKLDGLYIKFFDYNHLSDELTAIWFEMPVHTLINTMCC